MGDLGMVNRVGVGGVSASHSVYMNSDSVKVSNH